MYLHIGNDLIIHGNDIIGIFSLKYIRNTKEYKSLYNDLIEKNNIINISDGIEKTFILVNQNKRLKGIVTKISVSTVMKRLNCVWKNKNTLWYKNLRKGRIKNEKIRTWV